MNASTGPSNIFTEDEIAANITLRKNNVLSKAPKFIPWNIFGKVINNKDGPDEGFNPYAKTAGIIIKDAKRAAKVSNMAVCIADDGISNLSFI